jgi:hypothetical protein
MTAPATPSPEALAAARAWHALPARDSMEETITEIARALDAFASQAVAAKDNAYSERNLCVGVIARMAEKLGWPVWLGKHEGGEWDHDWRNILFIETPAGQISWHLHDREMHYFERFPACDTPWDGHSTTEKYERALAAAGTRSRP